MKWELLFLAAWSPLWALLLLRRPRSLVGPTSMGAGLAAFVGAMCCAELRRHGILNEPVSARPLWLGGYATELFHFCILGAAGASACLLLLDRVRPASGAKPAGEKDSDEAAGGD